LVFIALLAEVERGGHGILAQQPGAVDVVDERHATGRLDQPALGVPQLRQFPVTVSHNP
jgi:hypothetical protein